MPMLTSPASEALERAGLVADILAGLVGAGTARAALRDGDSPTRYAARRHHARKDAEGHWVTLDDGHHVFIQGGRVHATHEQITEAAKQSRVNPDSTLGAAIHHHAKLWNIHPDHLQMAVHAVHSQHVEHARELHAALSDARKATGLNARRIGQWEDAGKDHSSYPGLDTKARELAAEHPILGLGRGYSSDDGEDEGGHAEKLWEALSQPAERIKPRHHPDILGMAADLVEATRRHKQSRRKPDLSDIPF